MSLGEVINNYRKEHHMTMESFARAVGITKGYVSQLEKNISSHGKPIAPSLELYYKISILMGISLDELLKRAGGDSIVAVNTPWADALQDAPSMMRVPRLGAIACGDPILAFEETDEYDSVPEWTKADFTLVCKGDSMIGARIYDGDIACIRRQPTVENGEIAAVLIDEEVTLKRFERIGETVLLKPENPKYQTMVFTGKDAIDIHILGKATYFIIKVV